MVCTLTWPPCGRGLVRTHVSYTPKEAVLLSPIGRGLPRIWTPDVWTGGYIKDPFWVTTHYFFFNLRTYIFTALLPAVLHFLSVLHLFK
jgi:hypothetical protein